MTSPAVISTSVGGLVAVGAFRNTITLGSIIVGVLVGIVGLVILGYGARWKALAQLSSAQADELRKAFTDEKNRANSLYNRLTDMIAERNELTVRMARLEERPNLDKIVEIMRAQSAEVEQLTAKSVEAILGRLDERFETAAVQHDRRHAEISQTLTRAAEALERIGQGDTP